MTIREPHGTVRATYQGKAYKYPDAALDEGGTHSIMLREGPVELHNGIKNAFLRKERNGTLDLYGRRYEFRHFAYGNSELWCNGTRLVRLKRITSTHFRPGFKHCAMR